LGYEPEVFLKTCEISLKKGKKEGKRDEEKKALPNTPAFVEIDHILGHRSRFRRRKQKKRNVSGLGEERIGSTGRRGAPVTFSLLVLDWER